VKHTHHIVFQSHGGLDYDLNLIDLSYEDHEGDNGPHKNRAVDLMYKIGLQEKLLELFQEDELYTEKQVSEKLGRSERYWRKHLRKVWRTAGLLRGEDLVRFLMGGQLY